MRVLLVPAIIWFLIAGLMMPAFLLFLVAGISDAVDGAIARAFNQQSELGTILDPVADKLMLVSVFVVLSYLGHLPIWLAILVFSRDVLIVAGIIICFLLGKPVPINPIWISKANTTVQIVLACVVLGFLAFNITMPTVQFALEWLTGGLTAASAVAYMVQGARHLASEAAPMTSDTGKADG